ncbi:uncharacterized protein LOC125478701 [Pyrus x bretschneideri]|uniref:uncharacterized protein LOC125478701 n=1 Tax=Pyrus x bretschneideri TaxID=225117 RepID=UPI00202F1AF9|nr:uncharacterized protein LOC125478701 [Pyrus x bretschneideri]
MDFDLALRDNEPAKPTEDTTTEKKNEYEKWNKVNRMALLVIKRSTSDLVRGAIIELDNAKAYLDSIETKFKESEKAETGTLMNTLITTKYLGGGVREHILSMVDAAAKLNALNIKIDDVHLALNSLSLDATIHVTNSLQGYISKKVPNKDEVSKFVGNEATVVVE